jgi:hypothetical protein
LIRRVWLGRVLIGKSFDREEVWNWKRFGIGSGLELEEFLVGIFLELKSFGVGRVLCWRSVMLEKYDDEGGLVRRVLSEKSFGIGEFLRSLVRRVWRGRVLSGKKLGIGRVLDGNILGLGEVGC